MKAPVIATGAFSFAPGNEFQPRRLTQSRRRNEFRPWGKLIAMSLPQGRNSFRAVTRRRLPAFWGICARYQRLAFWLIVEKAVFEEDIVQQIRYFNSAWNDIKHTQGWFGKICLLSLIACIPVFGFMVLRGYLYGWARDIAWGVHEPMPAKIFGNEDGKLYRRGFYLLAFNFVLALVVYLLLWVIGMIPGFSTIVDYGYGVAIASYSALYYIVYFALLIVEMFIMWIGSMRISIYDRLSSGFQLGKIWSMYKHEPAGLWRIFGMQLLVGIIIGIVVGFVFTIVAVFIGVGSAGAIVNAVPQITGGDSASAYVAVINLISAIGPTLLIALFAMTYVLVVASVFLEMLVARAMGYWVYQFDVPHWRGQDDPMPFEELSA